MKKTAVLTIFSLIYVISRAINLSDLPLFADEAFAITRASEVSAGQGVFSMLGKNTQPIFIWLLALFQKLPFGVVTVSRLVSVISGSVTAFILAWAAHKHIDKKSWWIAYLLALVLPFSFFYERTVLFESLTAMFTAGTLILPVVSVPMAVLTKQSGWLALPLAAGINFRNRKETAKIIAVSLLVPLFVWVLGTKMAGSSGASVFVQKSTLSLTADFKSNLLRAKIWFGSFVTWNILVMFFGGAASALFDSVKNRRVTVMLWLAFWSVGVVLFEARFGRVFYPRYLYLIVVGLVLLATKGMWVLWGLIDRMEPGKTMRAVFRIVSLSVVIIPAIKTDWLIINNSRLVLPAETRLQFYEDWTSGVGSKEIADEIIKIAGGEKVNVYLEEENSYLITLKSDPRLKKASVETADWLVEPLTVIPQKILNEKAETLFIRNLNPDIPADWRLEELLSVNKSSVRKVTLYRIIKQ